jgi:hypothetical protein
MVHMIHNFNFMTHFQIMKCVYSPMSNLDFDQKWYSKEKGQQIIWYVVGETIIVILPVQVVIFWFLYTTQSISLKWYYLHCFICLLVCNNGCLRQHCQPLSSLLCARQVLVHVPMRNSISVVHTYFRIKFFLRYGGVRNRQLRWCFHISRIQKKESEKESILFHVVYEYIIIYRGVAINTGDTR